MSSRDPGLDEHLWETDWQALEPLVESSPGEALPELDDLLERMLLERGFELEQPAREEPEPEIVLEFREARRTTRTLERGAEVDPGDVAHAVNGYRAVYEYLMGQRRAP